MVNIIRNEYLYRGRNDDSKIKMIGAWFLKKLKGILVFIFC